ncbi:MAG TPA: cell envelope integrity protein CreD [Geobacteraceae bacterium]|nr:cell envelope integrity protein CreD [Geobacteraceae bacterium]
MTEFGRRGGMMEQARNSQILRIFCIAVLASALLIPVGMIDGVISERQNRREEAVREVTNAWGGRQTIIGPLLVVPYLRTVTEYDKDGMAKNRTETGHAGFLPESITTGGRLKCETRYRGIYKVPVYTAELQISGAFSRPDFTQLGIDGAHVLWDRAYLSLRVSDARAVMNPVSLRWNGREAPFLPGAGEFGGKVAGVHVPLQGMLAGERFEFSSNLILNGSEELSFAPLGKDTVVELASNWGSPSFQGNRLPVERRVSENGFSAKWSIPYLGRNYPQQWESDKGFDEAVLPSCFGIKFMPSLDQYSMAKRSTKYGILFILLTFVTLWLFELVAGVRIHPIQYLLVGAGLCLFFLLEISLAEHMGFAPAYLCATLLVTSLIYFYCRFVLGGLRRSTILATVVLLLYGYLYALLMNQDYALLIGSLCLFLVLGAVMFITRKIDWYSTRRQGKDGGEAFEWVENPRQAP